MTRDTENQETRPTRGVAAGVVAQAPIPGPAQRRLDAIIGKWINEGQTVASPGMPSAKILTSDVYEWMTGGFFVLHTAYGRIGDIDVGGTEIIGYDPASKTYRTTFYDSQGHVSSGEIAIDGDTWRWLGERTRATGRFSADGKSLPVLHERSDDGVTWAPSMEITLSRVD